MAERIDGHDAATHAFLHPRPRPDPEMSSSILGPGLRTLVDGLDHPEGVCWSPTERVLYAGGEAGQLYRFGLEGGDWEQVAQVPGGSILGLALDGVGAVYLCDTGNGQVQRVSPDGGVEPYGGPIAYPNYPSSTATGASGSPTPATGTAATAGSSASTRTGRPSGSRPG